MDKICQVCGMKFECEESETCWCNEFRINEMKLAELKSFLNDCVCKKCLLSKKSTPKWNLRQIIDQNHLAEPNC